MRSNLGTGDVPLSRFKIWIENQKINIPNGYPAKNIQHYIY
jgi:hypothetical protein